MAEEDAHFRLRLPVILRDRLVQLAERNQRSINAEVVARLRESLAKADEIAQMKKDLDQSIRHIERLEFFMHEITAEVFGEDRTFQPADWE